MLQSVGIGIQDFEDIRRKNIFYVDKTHFIKEWWENNDAVTLIARPRRFGKTLTMSMVEQFFSVKYGNRSDLFEGLSIWREEKYRQLQGTYPVIALSFANIKEKNYELMKYKMNQILVNLYVKYYFLLESDVLTEKDKDYFDRVSDHMSDSDMTMAIYRLSDYLYRYYGKKVIILLDEYDTPMQEAYVFGYWDEMVTLMRTMFNASFKTNPYLECALMTGITRVSKESIFSDLNNLRVVTTTSEVYADCFGFTEEEVFSKLDEYGMADKKQDVKRWYDGFNFGKVTDIYNPWSIINYFKEKRLATYWANTSSNGLVGKLIREGSPSLKIAFEELLTGGTITAHIDEQIVYNQLDNSEEAIWSLLLASGYLKVVGLEEYTDGEEARYEMILTNLEVRAMFRRMVRQWFGKASSDYNDFIKALLADDVDAMEAYMNRVAMSTFSFFDTGKNPLRSEPERFYHGFVLGLIVELSDCYDITSNRESGFGRYDVMLAPKNDYDNAYILEFKVHNTKREKSLQDTVAAAHAQIEEKQYKTSLISRGILEENIRTYGFAFEGKTVLIG